MALQCRSFCNGYAPPLWGMWAALHDPLPAAAPLASVIDLQQHLQHLATAEDLPDDE